MENNKQAEAVAERSAGYPDAIPHALTVESLLDRMDAIRQGMLSMKELTSTMEAIANQTDDDYGGHIAEAASQAFVARETTCQRELGFLERIYNDHFPLLPRRPGRPECA